MEIKTATVSQINNYIKKVFDQNLVLNNIWIKGEISNFKLHYSGHMYITLKDEGGVIKAVCFKSSAQKLTFMPKDGMKVLARGRISVYEASGAYQLYIEEMVEDGKGDLYAAYEKLKVKLMAEGLFSQAHKKPLPSYPKSIGVITAATGAAVRDIINVATRRFPYAKIKIYPVLVQGEGSREQICEAIEYFNEYMAADVLIVGRGGGSIEDLWSFNEECVAYAIYNSAIPIISAVGHETDFTIADFVADMRAPTPSAAAELAVPSTIELLSLISQYKNRMQISMQREIKYKRLKLEGLSPKHPKQIIEEHYLKIDTLLKRAEKDLDYQILNSKKQLSELAAKLNALSPLSVLSRGYSTAQRKDGKLITKVEQLEVNDEFILKLSNGDKLCKSIN